MDISGLVSWNLYFDWLIDFYFNRLLCNTHDGQRKDSLLMFDTKTYVIES